MSALGENLRRPDWRSQELTKFQKDFYKPSDKVKNRPTSEVEEYRKSHQIVVKTQRGEVTPNPIMGFTELELPRRILQLINQQGFKEPTPIQAQGWPIALSGNDLIGIAKTGSGKTLGFLVPAFIHVMAQPDLRVRRHPNDFLNALLLTFSREAMDLLCWC